MSLHWNENFYFGWVSILWFFIIDISGYFFISYNYSIDFLKKESLNYLFCCLSLFLRIFLKYNPTHKYIVNGIIPKLGEISQLYSAGIFTNLSEISGFKASSIVCIKTTSQSERERKNISVYIIVQTPITKNHIITNKTSP